MLKARIKPCKDKGGIVFINDEEGVNDLDETPEALDIRADDNAGLIIDSNLVWVWMMPNFSVWKAFTFFKIIIIGAMP